MKQEVPLTAEQIRNSICPYPQTMPSDGSKDQDGSGIPAGWRHVKKREGWIGQRWHRKLMAYKPKR